MPIKKKPATTTKRKYTKKATVLQEQNESAEKVLHHLAQSFAVTGNDNGLLQLKESMKVVGFAIGDPQKKTKEKNPSFVVPENDDGAITTTIGGVYGSYVDVEGIAKNELELITKYREMSVQPEAEYAIQDIINDAIAFEDFKTPPVTLDLTELQGYTSKFKVMIQDEFKKLLRLLNFKRKGQQIFKRWYVDGRLYYHIMIDTDIPKNGIQELRYIDPRRIKKVREFAKVRLASGAEVVKVINEYYVYNEKGIQPSDTVTGVKISPDSIVHCHSGLVDANKNLILSYLHKSIKAFNQLRYVEDATVIYRVSRAPERRIFYVDIGSMPAKQAQQYLNDVMNRYRNKTTYDAQTGEIRDDKKFMSMMDDFWIPRREGSQGTKVETLEGGANLGKMQDVEYFEKKLYQSLGVPLSRMSSDSGFNMGRSSEISRDEEKFTKFVRHLRDQFSELFYILLRTQLLLKGLITEADWVEIADALYFDFADGTTQLELRQQEILQNRFNMLTMVQPFFGSLISYDYAYKNILLFTEEEIEEMKTQLAAEEPRPSYDQVIQQDMETEMMDQQMTGQVAGQLKLQKAEMEMQAAMETGE